MRFLSALTSRKTEVQLLGLSLAINDATKSFIAESVSNYVIVSCAFFVFQQCVGQARKVHETRTLLLNFAKYSPI